MGNGRKFWDSSAIIPLVTDEAASTSLKEFVREDRQLHTWWAAEVECAAAFSRLEREGRANAAELIDRLREFLEQRLEIAPSSVIRETAKRLVRVHPLRAGDAFQLAAAWALSDNDPSSVVFVCLDHRLREAASREGFPVLPVL